MIEDPSKSRRPCDGKTSASQAGTSRRIANAARAHDGRPPADREPQPQRQDPDARRSAAKTPNDPAERIVGRLPTEPWAQERDRRCDNGEEAVDRHARERARHGDHGGQDDGGGDELEPVIQPGELDVGARRAAEPREEDGGGQREADPGRQAAELPARCGPTATPTWLRKGRAGCS